MTAANRGCECVLVLCIVLVPCYVGLSVLGWWRFVLHDCACESVADAVLHESVSSYFLLRVQGEKSADPPLPSAAHSATGRA